MNDALIAVLGLAAPLLSGLVMFAVGRRWERKKQSLLIRAQMLDPIREWLRGVERFSGIVGDTLTSVITKIPESQTYDLEEKRKAAQFMIENTNEVLGILDSESLSTGRTKSSAKRLAALISDLDRQVKRELLPLDDEILDRSAQKRISYDFVLRVGNLKSSIDSKVKEAYGLMARIKTALT